MGGRRASTGAASTTRETPAAWTTRPRTDSMKSVRNKRAAAGTTATTLPDGITTTFTSGPGQQKVDPPGPLPGQSDTARAGRPDPNRSA